MAIFNYLKAFCASSKNLKLLLKSSVWGLAYPQILYEVLVLTYQIQNIN